MKYIKVSIFLLALTVYGYMNSSSAYAVQIFNNVCSGPNISSAAVCQDVQQPQTPNSNALINIIRDAINILSFAVGVIAIILLILNGIKFVLSQGNANTVSAARSGIINSLIGVAVVAVAQTFVIFVLNRIN